jgi:hypothetical protein
LLIENGDPSDRKVTLVELAEDFAKRLISIFEVDATGHRPVFGDQAKFASDPHWRDCLLFYEHFHGETGQGLGASHQTGWTGLVAALIDEWQCQGSVASETRSGSARKPQPQS